MSYNSSKYSFTSANTVLNEEGIPVQREDYNRMPKGVKLDNLRQGAKKELVK